MCAPGPNRRGRGHTHPTHGTAGEAAEAEIMERVCFVGRVRPERLEEYRERHEHVWPEMPEANWKWR